MVQTSTMENLIAQAFTVAQNQMLKSGVPIIGDRISNTSSARTYQATVTGTGAVSATVKIEASNDLVGWLPLGTITLSGTNMASDGFPSETMWIHLRANLTAISGTGAVATVTMGSGSNV